MSQIGPQNPYQPPMPGGQQPRNFPQPVVYRPGQGNPMMTGDVYRPGMPNSGPVQHRPGMPGSARPGMPGATRPAEPPVEYVSKKDVAFGLLGAVGGYFAAGMLGLTGPIGALVVGLALLGISAVGRGVKRAQAKKAAKQMQPPQNMPQAPNYPGQQQPQFQNRYNYENQGQPGQQQDPRYRYPGQ